MFLGGIKGYIIERPWPPLHTPLPQGARKLLLNAQVIVILNLIQNLFHINNFTNVVIDKPWLLKGFRNEFGMTPIPSPLVGEG